MLLDFFIPVGQIRLTFVIRTEHLSDQFILIVRKGMT